MASIKPAYEWGGAKHAIQYKKTHSTRAHSSTLVGVRVISK